MQGVDGKGMTTVFRRKGEKKSYTIRNYKDKAGPKIQALCSTCVNATETKLHLQI